MKKKGDEEEGSAGDLFCASYFLLFPSLNSYFMGWLLESFTDVCLCSNSQVEETPTESSEAAKETGGEDAGFG